jgi:hypothetical protein
VFSGASEPCKRLGTPGDAFLNGDTWWLRLEDDWVHLGETSVLRNLALLGNKKTSKERIRHPAHQNYIFDFSQYPPSWRSAGGLRHTKAKKRAAHADSKGL